MKTVLIVDDSALMRRMMKNLLTKNGYEVIGEAGNGKIGVAKYTELNPDIVTMDVVMDEMNGLEALSHILGINPNANVVMVSSMGQDVIIRDAIILGAKHFLLKPFNEKQVIEAFNKL
jgi:two-component system chemotaxis response regulator CheY